MLECRTLKFLVKLNTDWYKEIENFELKMYRAANTTKPTEVVDKEFEVLVKGVSYNAKKSEMQKLKMDTPALKKVKIEHKKALKLNIALRYIIDLELKYKYILKCVSLIGKKRLTPKLRSKLNDIDIKLKYVFNKLKDPEVALRELEMDNLLSMQSELANDLLEAEKELVNIDLKIRQENNPSLLPDPPKPEQMEDFLLDEQAELRLKEELLFEGPDLENEPNLEIKSKLELKPETELDLKQKPEHEQSLEKKDNKEQKELEAINKLKLQELLKKTKPKPKFEAPKEGDINTWYRQQRQHGEASLDKQMEFHEGTYDADNPFKKGLPEVTSAFKSIKYPKRNLRSSIGEPKANHIFSVFKDTYDEMGKLSDIASKNVEPTLVNPSDMTKHPYYVPTRPQRSHDGDFDEDEELGFQSKNEENFDDDKQ